MTDAQEKRVFKTQEIIGKRVITLEGEDLGAISRVLVNPESTEVAGLIVSGKGWFKGDKAFEFSSVNSIGNYALTIEKSDLVVPLNTLPTLDKLANEFNIYDTRVITPTGELIGNVDDFSFDADSGKIENLLLSGGLIKNLMQGKALINIDDVKKLGPDVIITKDDATDSLSKAETGLSDNIDNWKGNLDSFKDDFENNWDSTVDKAKDLSKKLGDKIKVVGGEGKNDLINTYEKWREKLQNLKNRNQLTTDELSSLLWKRVGRDIYDDDNNLIIAKNEEVSPEVLEKVQEADKLKELLLSIATLDVEEKIESIEQEQNEEI